MMNRPPDKIFLHWETANVWWWYPRRQNDNDIEYIYFPQLVEGNYDLRQKNKDLQAENERYREALIKIAEYNHPSNETIQIARDILGVKEPPALNASRKEGE